MLRSILFLLSFLLLSSLSAQTISFNILSFNIRYDNPKDGINAWPNRKEKVVNTLLFHEADIIGMQEALQHQIEDIEKLLPPNYTWEGVGRTDGKEKGEYSPIFYNADKFKLVEKSTFWLSETPEMPGTKGWDAALPRIVTWLKLKDKNSGKVFFVFNTHFDHRGELARQESAKLIVKQVSEIVGNFPVILLGDFNANPSSEPYRILTQELTDARMATELPWSGSEGTFNGFGNPPDKWKVIDFIFIKGGVEVLKAGTLSTSWDGQFVSDHFPVFAKIRIE